MTKINNDYNLLNALLRTNRNGMYGSNFPLSFYQGMARVEQQNAELEAKVAALFEEQAAAERAYSVSLSRSAKAQMAEAQRKPIATLEDMIKASKECHDLNEKRLENAGNRINVIKRARRPDDLIQEEWDMYVNCIESEFSVGNHYITEADNNVFNRQMINRQIENIFKEHDIEFPAGEELLFTIDPYDGRISVSGENTTLAEQVEKALNAGQSSSDPYNNGNSLYDHIFLCIVDYDNSQFDNDLYAKRSAHRHIRIFTGVDLTQCTKTADDYITADGRSVKQMVSDYFDRTLDSTNSAYKEDFIRGEVTNMMRYDFSDGQDLHLQIRYTDTGLHDIGQENGYGNGQTGWIYDMVKEMEERDQKPIYLGFL